MELHLNEKSLKINNHDIRRVTTVKRDSRKEIVILRKQSNEPGDQGATGLKFF